MAANTVEIRITASGAEQAQRVLAGIAQEGAQLGSITASGAKKAEEAFGSFSVGIQKVSGLMAQAGVNTGIFGQAISALTSPLGIAAASATALGLAIHRSTESMVRNFEEVRRIQAVSGLSADAADNLADTFQLLGFKSEVLTTAMIKMAQEIETGGKGFAKLGLSIEDLQGKVEGDTFLMLRDRISQLGTAGERSAAGMALFGRGFRELAPMFAMTSAEFAKFQERASKFSAWSDEAAEATHRFVVSGNTLTLMFDGIAQEIGAALLPGLTAFNEGLADWVEAARDVLRVPIAEAWAVVASVATGLWDAVKPLAEVLWQLAKVILPPLAAILGGALVAGLVAVQAALIPVTGTFVFLSEILKGNFTGAITAAGDAMNKQLKNIDETLAKSKALGETLAALARGEVAAVEETDAAREKSNQKNAQLEQLKMQRAAAGLQVAQANAAAEMALEVAMVQQRVALHQAPETDLVAAQQRALDQKLAALKASYAVELAMAQQNNDLTGKAVADVQAKYIASYNQIAVARVGLSTKLLQITQEEEMALAGGGIALLQARLASTAALLAIQQKSTADIIAIQGSEEAVFRSRLNIETQAAIDAAEIQTKTQADFAAAVEAIMRTHYAKLADFQKQASASSVAAMLADMALAMKDLADLPEVATLTKDLVALNREIMALRAPTDLDAEAIKRFGVAFDLLDEATKKALLDLRALRDEGAGRAFANDLAVIGAQAAVLGGYFDGTAATISRLQQRLKALADDAKGTITPEMRELGATISGMIDEARLKDALGLTRTTFDLMVDAARATAQNMTAAFSDLFFHAFTGQLKSAADVFKAFALSMLRVLSDFLAQSVVKNFLTFLTSAGKSSSASAPGVAGADTVGEGFDVTGLLKGASSGISGAQTFSGLSSTWATITDTWSSMSLAFQNSEGIIEGVGGAWDALTGALSASELGLSGMSLALGYVGSAVQGILTILDKSKTDLGKGIQTATLAAGVALAPFTAGISLVVAPIINWLEDLFGLFKKGPSNYDLKRLDATEAANALLGSIGSAFASAARSGTAADTLAALRSGQAPAGSTPNPLRTDLSLPPALAEQLGLAAKAEIENGRAIVHWADVTQAQFDALIELFKTDPSMIAGSVMGKGDVSYLGQDQTHGLGQSLQEGAVALLTAFTAFESVRDKIRGLATDIVAAAQEVMPADMAQQLAEHIVNPIRDQMLALLQNPDLSVKDLQAQLDALGQTLQAKVQEWAKFSDALKAITLVDALIPADIAAQMHAAIQPAYDAVITAMRTGTAEQAKLAVDTFTKQAAAWAAFGQSVGAAIDVDAILPTDLGARFHAIMQPEYDKIIATLKAGNVDLATAQTAAFNRRLAVFSALGQTETAGLDVKALLPKDLAAQFDALMGPEWAKILADIVTNVDLAAIELGKFNKQLAAFATLGQTKTAASNVEALLPADFAERFRAVMQPQWDKILVDIATNADLAAAELEKLNKQLTAWAHVATTIKTIDASISTLSTRDDPAAAWQAVKLQLDTTAARAKTAFDAALSSGDVERIAATAAAYHDAVMANLQAELEMAKQIEEAATAAQTAALDAASGLVAIGVQVAQLDIAGGQGFTTITALLGSLQAMATTGTTAAQRMWAVDQALQAIIAVLPTAIEQFGAFQTAAEWLAKGMQTAGELQASGPTQITGAVVSAAAPFLTAMQDLIDAAAGPDKLALLQQQASNWTALANAAIAGVQQWADAAIKGAQEAAQAVIDGLQAQKMAALDAIDAQIAGIQAAAQADQEARAAEMQALSEQIAKAQEFEAAIASMAKFIQALKVGPLGPGNPMDKLSRAQDAYAKALAAYNANPTAAGLAGLQDLAQTMLALAEPIFTKPSPQFQALVALTIKQLEAAAALAKGQMTDSETLKAQLKALQDADKAAAQGVRDQIAALNDQKKTISDKFDDQIKAVEDARDKQIEAIKNAAKDEIAGINAGLAAALKDNMAAQAPLLQAQFDAANALLAAVGPTAQFQIDAVNRLTEIRDAILSATSAESGMARVTEGLYHLHDGEMVLPRAMADRIRSAADGAGMPNDPDAIFAPGSGSKWDPWIVDAAPAFLWTGPKAAELNALENQIRLAHRDYAATLAHNTYKRGGKIYHQHSAEELAAMQAAMDARIADWRAQQQAIVAAIPKAPPGPPPGGPPPKPPYVPPGPGWLTRNPQGGPQAGAQLTINVTVNGDSQDEKRIAKAVAKEVLPIVQGDAKNGKLGVIIDQRAKSVR